MSRLVHRSAFAAMLAFVTGCSAGEAERGGERQQALFANDKTAYDYFVGKGLTNFQAAGVVGNLDQESGIDPSIHQAGGGVGRGIAQWSAGARWDTTDKDNVLQYASQHGQSATSLTLQLDFIWYELTTFPEYGLTELQASQNLTDATTVFEDKFEGCVYANYPECALPSRVNFAKGILNAYGASSGTGGVGGGGAGGGGASGGGASGGGASGGGAAGGGAGGSGGAGGTSIGGAGGSTNTTVGGSAGSSGAGAGGAIAGTTTGGSGGETSTSSGAPSAAGSTGTPGSTTSAGNTTSGGNDAVAGGSSFANPSTNAENAGCAFSPPARSTSLASVIALVGLAFFARRRRGPNT